MGADAHIGYWQTAATLCTQDIRPFITRLAQVLDLADTSVSSPNDLILHSTVAFFGALLASSRVNSVGLDRESLSRCRRLLSQAIRCPVASVRVEAVQALSELYCTQLAILASATGVAARADNNHNLHDDLAQPLQDIVPRSARRWEQFKVAKLNCRSH